MGKQIVPVSGFDYLYGNIAIFGIHPFPTRQASSASQLPQTACLHPRNIHKTNEKSIFLWCECRKYTFSNEKSIFWYQMNQPIESIK